MSSEVVWSLPKRVAFRFGFLAAVLYVYPLPLGFIPKTDWLAEALQKPWNWLVVWFAESVLGTDTPPLQPTGSGDTLHGWVSFALTLVLAGLGAALWSVVDERRHRTAYPRLATATWIGLRYLLAITLLGYGFAKLIDTQFPPLDPYRLDQRVGEMSPMGMLWTFQGASTAYTFFGGLAEALAAVLLLWRRTATLGALVAMGVLTNVVVLNFCYDVPVKLYSAQLWFIAGVIAMPQLRRIVRALLGAAVPEVVPRVRSSARVERARWIVKLVALALIALNIYTMVDDSRGYLREPSELYGAWSVDTWRLAGVDRPPLTTDRERWCRLLVTQYGAMLRTCDGERAHLFGEVIPAGRVIAVRGERIQLWRYARTGEHLAIDASYGGKPLHVTLTRDAPPLLVSRGFHWIQEFPFNR